MVCATCFKANLKTIKNVTVSVKNLYPPVSENFVRHFKQLTTLACQRHQIYKSEC